MEILWQNEGYNCGLGVPSHCVKFWRLAMTSEDLKRRKELIPKNLLETHLHRDLSFHVRLWPLPFKGSICCANRTALCCLLLGSTFLSPVTSLLPALFYTAFHTKRREVYNYIILHIKGWSASRTNLE